MTAMRANDLWETHTKQVAMGHLSVGGHDDQLQALLGSCIGIGFIWKKATAAAWPIACCRKHRGRTPAWARAM